MKFVYRNNKVNPPQILLEITTESILEADNEFKKKTNLDPVKCPWIGCEVLKETP